MAARYVMNHTQNFPVKLGKLSEGAVTRADVVLANGSKHEGAITRAAAVAKGDFVRLVESSTDKDFMVVEKATAGNDEDYVVGIVVSEPAGQDAVTVSGNPADVAQMRTADIMLFGIGIIEIEVNANMAPGDYPELSESESNVVGVGAHPAVLNGGMIALKYGVDGEKVPFLVGYAGYLPADV